MPVLLVVTVVRRTRSVEWVALKGEARTTAAEKRARSEEKKTIVTKESPKSWLFELGFYAGPTGKNPVPLE